MAYTIVSIEGEGEEAEYVRLADDLVRRSKLFNSFTFKHWRDSQQIGRQREIRKRWRARYYEVRDEYVKYEREASALLKYQQTRLNKAITTRDKAVKELHEYRARTNVIIQNLKKGIASKKPLEKYRDLVMKNQRFFETEFKFRDGSFQDYVRAEMMLRTIFVYEKEKATKGISHAEYMFLALGTQLPAFRKEDFEARFPDFTKYFNRDLNGLIKAGYVTKFYRQPMWYLTGKGKERFKEIISQMYNKQIGYYWKGIFEKL